jgi:hypothetical protein
MVAESEGERILVTKIFALTTLLLLLRPAGRGESVHRSPTIGEDSQESDLWT